MRNHSELAGEKAHVPYRNSKLTLLLKDALEGGARTTVLVCASLEPRNAVESIASLRFGEAWSSLLEPPYGRPASVTISTNMAGRGTDILLGGNAGYMARLLLRARLGALATARQPQPIDASPLGSTVRALCSHASRSADPRLFIS